MASQSGSRRQCPLSCQESAEKGLKAFLVWHQQTFRRTHDLEEIGRACTTIDIALGPITLEADALTDFAWRARYPGNPYTLEVGEVAAMLELVQRVLAEIESRLLLPPQP